MKMTDSQIECIRNTTGKRQVIKVDANLFLFAEPTGAKNWYVRYIDPASQKQKSYKLGIFDLNSEKHISIREAQRLALNVCHGANEGESPEQVNKKFAEVAEEWLDKYINGVEPTTAKSAENRYRLYIETSSFYRKNIRDVKKIEISQLLTSLKKKQQTARKVRSLYNMIFDYARGYGYIDGENPVPDLKFIFGKPAPEQNRAATIDNPERFGEIVARIKLQYEAEDNGAGLLLFLAYCFTRPKEARLLQWHHIVWKDNIVKLSSSDTKTKAPLVIPLSRQVSELFERQKNRRCTPIMPNDYVFFARWRGPKFAMSDAAPTVKLTQLGVARDEQSAHGFRACASTYLREYLDVEDNLIEIQLNHVRGTEVSRAYNKSTKLSKRKEMMQAWADWVDAQSEAALKRLVA